MGNQQSKGTNGEGDKPSRLSVDGLQSYPSFSKSETKDSVRSFSGFRGKIAKAASSSSKLDSPRPSISPSEGDKDKNGEDANARQSADIKGRNSTATERDVKDAPVPKIVAEPLTNGGPPHLNTEDTSTSFDADNGDEGEAQPPPSPLLSATMGKGHKQVDEARKTGEVDHVSDEPPKGSLQSSAIQQPKASILMKKGNPVQKSSRLALPIRVRLGEGSASPSMGMSALNSVDLDEMINRLLDAGYSAKPTKAVCLKNAEITAICTAIREVLLAQPALLELSQPVKIVGDIHGQYTDLLRTFEMCGFPPQANYLFLGDYVDRGKKSLETILLLFCYKLKFPENFFLLRGNHESANVTRVYGFYDECKRRCNIKIWKTFIDAFNCLPIAAIVANKIFCVHGGLSPALTHMDDIRQIARPTDVPDYGLLNDLLWADPAELDTDWEANERGVSFLFGKKVIQDFLAKNDFDLVCRAHMVVEDGYEFFTDRILVTVFSAPNYCGEFDNWGAVMSVSDELLCSFELLKPLDSSALKNHIKKGRHLRASIINSPPAMVSAQSY